LPDSGSVQQPIERGALGSTAPQQGSILYAAPVTHNETTIDLSQGDFPLSARVALTGVLVRTRERRPGGSTPTRDRRGRLKPRLCFSSVAGEARAGARSAS
jgi:hypothetical protein